MKPYNSPSHHGTTNKSAAHLLLQQGDEAQELVAGDAHGHEAGWDTWRGCSALWCAREQRCLDALPVCAQFDSSICA